MKSTISTFAAALFATAALFPSFAHAGNIVLVESPNMVQISGSDYELGLQANGQNIDTNYGGSTLTLSLGTPINFSGGIVDFGASSPASQHIYVLPFAGANYAISDLDFSNSASDGYSYSVVGTYNSLENIAVPNGATTIVAGDTYYFGTAYSANYLVTAAVPEPASMTMLGVGVAAAWLVLRRKNKACVQA